MRTRAYGPGKLNQLVREAKSRKEQRESDYEACWTDDGHLDEDKYLKYMDLPNLKEIAKERAAYAEEIRRRQPSAFRVQPLKRGFWATLFG